MQGRRPEEFSRCGIDGKASLEDHTLIELEVPSMRQRAGWARLVVVPAPPPAIPNGKRAGLRAKRRSIS
jgi:hypothetical protein